MALGSTQPLTEISTRNLPGGKGRPARKADNLTVICESDCLENMDLDVSQIYGPPQSVTGIALSFLIFYAYFQILSNSLLIIHCINRRY
jgi:hypothetical protein